MDNLTHLTNKLQRENQELKGLVVSKDAEIHRLQGALASVSRRADEGGIAGAHPESAVLTGEQLSFTAHLSECRMSFS